MFQFDITAVARLHCWRFLLRRAMHAKQNVPETTGCLWWWGSWPNAESAARSSVREQVHEEMVANIYLG